MESDAAQWYANTVAVWALGVSGVAIVASIASTCFSFMQAKAAQAQVDEAKRSREVAETTLELQGKTLKSQADQGAAALKATELAAEAARQSAEIAARAFSMQGPMLIVVDYEGRVTPGLGELGEETQFRFKVILKNIGNSLAYDTVATEKVVVAKEFPLPTTPNVKIPSRALGTIGPGLDKPFGEEFSFATKEVEEWLAEGKIVFVVGEARYEDTINHVMRVCPWRYSFDGKSRDPYKMTLQGNTPYVEFSTGDTNPLTPCP